MCAGGGGERERVEGEGWRGEGGGVRGWRGEGGGGVRGGEFEMEEGVRGWRGEGQVLCLLRPCSEFHSLGSDHTSPKSKGRREAQNASGLHNSTKDDHPYLTYF